MSYSNHSSFSTNYGTLDSMQLPNHWVWLASSAASVYAGIGGSGSWISMSHSTSIPGGWGSGGLTAGMTGGLAGLGDIQINKETMQCLNDCLASYLKRVRSLETDCWRLESKIQEHLEKGPQVIDWQHYFKIIEDLRTQIFASSVDDACIVLQIDNDRLAADDFRVKYEMELAMCQSVESDINGF